MTIPRVSPISLTCLSKFFWLLLAFIGMLDVASVHAVGPPSGGPVFVGYNPDNLQSVQGDAPFHYGYVMTVTSPSTTPSTGTLTITLNCTVVTAPDGADTAAAAAYLTFSVPTLTFTGPNQVQQVTVSLDIPYGSASGDFTYWITTSGWPSGYNISDLGTYINMHVNPPGTFEPPAVSISSPADETEYSYTIGGDAVQVPITVSGAATESAPVLTLVATISGTAADGSAIAETTLDLAKTGLGSSNAQGSVVLPVSVAGNYTITATATNFVGESVTTSTFIVNEVVPPPVVTIDPPANNPSYSFISGVTSVTVPYAFVATSYRDGIQTLTATLDGVPFTIGTVAGLGQLTATGSGSFVFNSNVPNASGQHTITVTATDPHGTATTAATFVVNVLFPQIATTIATPANGSTLYLPPDASPLNVPFSFTTVATNSATVLAVSATLTGGDATTVSVPLASVSGLGSTTASGSGTLLNVLPGTYTLGALGTNDTLGLSSYASTTFTVLPPPPPVTAITQPPQAAYTALAGYALTIPFTGVTTSTGAYITTQVATLDGQPVTLSSNANGTALTATATGTLSLTSTATGTTTHTLVVTGTDTYGQTSTAQTTFTVTVNQPVITIAINPQISAGSPYTLPTSGSLTIPFTFTGNITTGATVDTIVGALGGTPVSITATTGLGTAATATASGNLVITAPGTYTLTATDTNTVSGVSATTSVTFTVNKAATLPALSICFTQAPAATYYYQGGCSSLSIPYVFMAKSSGGKVQTVSATLDGKAVSLSSTYGLGTSTAYGTGTLSVKTAGVHTLVAIATDNYGQTVTTTTTFTVTTTNPVIAVSINSPSADSVYYLPVSSSCNNSSSVKIPFSFTSTITAGATIDALSASLNGNSVSVTSSGLGSASATGTGTLSVSKIGKYTLTVKGIDATTGVYATSSVVFYVQRSAPPTVDITQPTQTTYTSYSGCASLSIPYAFVAGSTTDVLTKLTATIDGQALTPTVTGLGTLSATGSGTLSVKSSGKHVLTVTSATASGTASDSFTFYVTVVNPTPTVDISQPTDCAVFTYTEGDAVPAIPFTFTAKTNAGATISALKASLGSTSLSVTSTGVGTAAATGTGTIKVTGAGTYTLTATATSGTASVTDKVTFTVKMLARQKPCTVVWQSSACQGRVQKGGHNLGIKFQIQCKDGRDDSIVNDPSVKVCVYEVYTNGSTSTPRIYSASNYTIDRNRQYGLDHPTNSGSHRYRVDVYRFPSGSSTPELIGTKECSTK